MNMLLNLESPVTTAHRAKLAYIYVRQSTAGQVRQHQESTELQYRLVDRAALFGWPKERIEVIRQFRPQLRRPALISICFAPADVVGSSPDSPLEEAGFEPSMSMTLGR